MRIISKDFPDVMMYYPAPEKYPPQNEYRLSLFERLRNGFKNILKKVING